jgi:hypothetical protein
MSSYSGVAEKNSFSSCNFICEPCFDWNGVACVPNLLCKSIACSAPSTKNYVWTSNNESSYTQTLINGSWIPAASEITTAYAENESDSEEPCKYLCNTGYAWNGSDCVSELDYCGLVGFNADLVDAHIGESKLDLVFNISCAEMGSVLGVDTIINSVSFFSEDGTKINNSSILSACEPEAFSITRTMDSNAEGIYAAVFSFGPSDFGCSRTIFFGLTDEYGVTDASGNKLGGEGGDQLNVPDNNLIFVLLIMIAVSVIILRKKESNN